MSAPRRRRLPLGVQIVLAAGIFAALAYYGWQLRQERAAPPTEDLAAEKAPADKQAAVVRNATILDRDGNVVYRGEVDLSPTIARIKAGRKLPEFRNDGSVFQNREGRLPRQPAGYYREWVHPTPKLLPSPGPQRIVAGQGGEFYYTADHYETFQRLKLKQAKEEP